MKRNDNDPRLENLRIYVPQAETSPMPFAEQQAFHDDNFDRLEEEITDAQLDALTGGAETKSVSISLGQMVPLLIDAAEKNRLWLNDFADENVEIDSDLYEILLAYGRMRRREAA